MHPGSLEEKARRLAEEVLGTMGLELVDLTYASEHGRKVLRLYIDKPGGITLDDCGEVSREFGMALDVHDFMPESYDLEVSSPGLDRPLKKESDFKRYIGKRAKIKTREPIEGRKNFKALINGVEDGKVLVTDFDDRKFEIHIAIIEKAKLEIEF